LARTTLAIDTSILDEVKRIREQEGGSLGRVVTRLITEALTHRCQLAEGLPGFDWASKAKAARVDLADRDAVYEILDGGDRAADR